MTSVILDLRICSWYVLLSLTLSNANARDERQKNARTPLSLVFDDKSALEQLHYQLLLRVMRHHGLGVLFDNTTHGNRAKKLLCETVLATDMGVHDDFMRRMEAMATGEVGPICNRQIITCQALLKCADISNPVSDTICLDLTVFLSSDRAGRMMYLSIGLLR